MTNAMNNTESFEMTFDAAADHGKKLLKANGMTARQASKEIDALAECARNSRKDKRAMYDLSVEFSVPECVVYGLAY